MGRWIISRGLFVAALVMIASCGGGGGGGDSGGTGSPPPGGSNQAPISAADAHNVVLIGNGFFEGPAQLGISVLDNLFDLNDASGLSASMSCRRVISLGSGTIELMDNDANSIISSGDQVRMSYFDCYQDSLQDAVTGRVDIEIIALSIQSDGSTTGEIAVSTSTSLNFDDGNGGTVSINASFRLAFTATPDTENLTFSMTGGDSFRVLISNGSVSSTEVGTNLNLRRGIDSSGRYGISGSVSIDSELIGGVLSCSIPSSLLGSFLNFPESGTLRCVGRSNSSARLVAVASDQTRTEVDEQGSGSYSDAGVAPNGNGLWGDYVEGSIFGTRVDLPSGAPSGTTPTISSTAVTLDVTDVAHDPDAGLLYVTNDAGISIVDTTTMTVTGSFALADRPDPIALSDDGSTLWVGFKDATEIVSLDTATMTPGARIPLGVTIQFGSDRYAGELRVVPGTTDTVVVSITGGAEMLAFSGGALLPTIVDDFFSPTVFEFLDASTLVGVDAEISSRPVSIVTVDANGLTVTRQLPYFGDGTQISLEGARLWGNRGRVSDAASETIFGRVDFDQSDISGFRTGVAADAMAGRAYFYEPLSNLLDFYDTSTLTALGTYRVNTNGIFRTMIKSPADELFLFMSGEIHRVDTTSLGQNMRNTCTTADLGGQLGPNVFLQIECAFNDSVYDSDRDLIYATVPSAAGPNGNSVAIIDPTTGSIQGYIYVGSEPTDLSISGTGNRLYVALSEANRFAEVDLQAQALVASHNLVPDPTFGWPQFPVAVDASPANDSDVLIATDQRTIGHYSSGVQATNVVDRASRVLEVFFNSTADRGYAFTENRDLWSFDVESTGATNETETRGVSLFGDVSIKNDILYGRGGNMLDPETATVVKSCPVGIHTGAEPDPGGVHIYYFQFAFDSTITVCDENTLSTESPFTVPRFGDGALYKTMTVAGPRRLAITGNSKMLLLDPSEF